MHTVYLDSFHIDKYEVTNAQYSRFLNEYGEVTDPAGHPLINIDNDWCKIIKDGDTYKPVAGYRIHPVVNVSWYGAAAYAQYYGVRLPTEAEWEKAARGGWRVKDTPGGILQATIKQIMKELEEGMSGKKLPRRGASQTMAMACMTWRVMYGSGALMSLIGITMEKVL